jgi:hypothetical protein
MRLNQIAIRQMQTLTAATALRQIQPPKEIGKPDP